MEGCEMDQSPIFSVDGGRGISLLNRTVHSIKRCRQRGIKEADLILIMVWGSRIRKPGRVYEYFISKKDRERIIQDLKYSGNPKYQIQKLDKLVGKAIIVDEGHAVIITAYCKNN
jgi:hypothetical protein